jgi:carbon-monoxide dehydrogenase large subunit
LASCTGIPEHRVIVSVPDVGGAFGQKIPVAPEEIAIALAAIRLGRFVKWIEDRQENLTSAPQARDQVVTLRLALDDEQRFTALDAYVLGDAGAYSFNSASALIEPYLTARTLPGPYRIKHLRTRVVARVTNKAPIAPYRGVGFSVSQAARELLIDEAARRLDAGRLDLRIGNLIRPEEMPFETCNGMRYDSGDYPLALRMAAGSAEEESARLSASGRLGSESRIGVGFAPYVEPTGWGSEGLRQVGWDSFPSYDAVDVSLQPSGDVTVRVGTCSQGQGSETSLAELVAGVFGISAEDVVVRTSDGTARPVSLGGTRASRTAVVTGGALGLAAVKVRDEVVGVAAHLLEIDSEDLELRDGMIVAKGVPSKSITFREAVAAGFRDVRARPGGSAPTFSAHEFYDPGASYSSGAVGAVVEVDVETGVVKVNRVFAVEDCGTVINATVVDGQVVGGLVQGLGYALFERVVHDAAGQPQTASLLDYLPPFATDVPPIDVEHLCSPSPFTWGGIKGVGEAGMVGGPAAIAAAVADAISPCAVDQLPITPANVVAAWQRQRAKLQRADDSPT